MAFFCPNSKFPGDGWPRARQVTFTDQSAVVKASLSAEGNLGDSARLRSARTKTLQLWVSSGSADSTTRSSRCRGLSG